MSITVFPEAQRAVQFGVEDTAGTPVPCIFRFAALQFDVDAKKPTTEVRRQGSLLPVGNVPGKGHTEAKVKGDASVEDLIIALATMWGAPTFAVAGTLANTATFLPNNYATNVPETLTVQEGFAGAGNARRFAYGHFRDLEIDFVPDKQVAVSGTMFGQNVVTGQTFTASPTTLDKGLLLPSSIDVYLATSEAGLAAGQIGPLSVKCKMNKVRGDVYALKSSDSSYSAIVDTMPDIGFDIVVPRTTAADTYLAAIDTESLYYIEIVAKGAVLETVAMVDYYEQLTIRAPVEFTNPGEGVTQDAHTSSFTLNCVQDDTFDSPGGFLKIVAQSLMTAESGYLD